MKITVIGSGYAGLASGACLAEPGDDVMCMDVDARKIAMHQQRESSSTRAVRQVEYQLRLRLFQAARTPIFCTYYHHHVFR